MALDGLHATDEEFSPIHFWDRVGEIATIDTTINVSLHFNKCTNCYYIDIWDTEIILSFDDHEEFRISTEDFTTGDEAESDGIVMLNLMNRGPEDMTIMFYPTSRDGYRYVNIVYNYDESTIDDEWYEKKAFWYANVTITLYSTEEEYFQASTIEDLVLTPEENQRMNDFIDSFHQLIQTRKQEKKSYGKSTS